MSVKIQLFGEEKGFIEIDTEQFDAPVEFAVSSIKDPSKKSGARSYTLTAKGTKNNNKELGHYYNVNLKALTFDASVLQSCSIVENDIVILDNAYLQLVSVNKSSSSSRNVEFVTYKLIVKSSVGDFFTTISDRFLTDIDFSDLNHTFNSTNVIASFAHDYTDAYKYLLGYTPNSYYQLTECRPGIYAKTYFDRIVAASGFAIEWDTELDSGTEFDKWFIPYNGGEPKLRPDFLDLNETICATTLAEADDTGNTFNLQPFTGTVIFDTEIKDLQNTYDPVTGIYTSLFTTANNTTINGYLTGSYSLKLINLSGGDAYLRRRTSFSANNYGYTIKPNFLFKDNGSSKVYNNSTVKKLSSSTIQINTTNASTYTIQNGTTILDSRDIDLIIPLSGVRTTEEIINQLQVDIQPFSAGNFGEWRDADSDSGNVVDVEMVLEITDARLTYQPAANGVSFGTTIQMNEYIPKKIKQSDFIKSILTMNNLLVLPHPSEDNTLVFVNRDDYYNEGKVVDWSKKFSKEVEHTIALIPELTSKRTKFTYKTDKDTANENYFDAIGETYGEVEFVTNNEYVRGDKKNELIFSPTPIGISEKIGSINPLINGFRPKNNIRVLYDGGTKPCSTFKIYDYNTTGDSTSVYPVLTHFDDPEAPTFDLNFGVCDFYFYPLPVRTYNNIYNLNWRRTMNQINDGKLLTGFFHLTNKDIALLEMSDKIFVQNQYWNVNKLTYNAGKNELTKVELITASDEISIAKFNRKNPTPPDSGLSSAFI
jgi:hypothetical protein